MVQSVLVALVACALGGALSDTKLGEGVMRLIHDEMKQRRTAAVIVTHDVRMVQYAERVVHITDGILDA